MTKQYLARCLRLVALIAVLFTGGFVGLPRASADNFISYNGLRSVQLARSAIGDGACSKNPYGGVGFASSCTGNGGQPEYWCSDFVRWIWAQMGVPYTSELTAASASFYTYGLRHGTLTTTPAVGDAVVFDYTNAGGYPYADHVAIVTQVNPDGTIESISGDWNGQSSTTEAGFASTSSVMLNSPPYSSAVGSSSKVMGMTVSGYVAPVGGQSSIAALQDRASALWTAGPTGWTNWGVGLAPGTSPSLARLSNGGYEVAFQGFGGALWTIGTAGWTNWGVGLAPGTSPAITALPGGGFEVAFEGFSGTLWTVGNAGWTDWGVGIAPGTSPSIAALAHGGFEVAFQAQGQSLWTVGNAGWTNWGVGVAPRTSPAIAPLPGGGWELAFQASGGHLWTVGSGGWTDWGLGVGSGSSPGILALPSGGFQVAFQASGGSLWTVGSAGWTNWGFAMAPGSSPSITIQPGSGIIVSYEGSDGKLWTAGPAGQPWSISLAPGSNASIQ